MRIAKDQKERHDNEMAEKMENAKKAQVEKEAAEAAAWAQAQAAKKAAEEAKAIAKTAAKKTAKSNRSADENTGAIQKSKKTEGRKEAGAATHGGCAAVAAIAGSATGLDKAGTSEKESKVGVTDGGVVDGGTGDNQDLIVDYFVEEEKEVEEEENHSYEDSDIENEGQKGKGGKGAEAVREEKGEGYGEGKKLVKEDSLAPDTEIGKKFKDCKSCHYRLKQFTLYSFKIYELKHIEIKQ